MAGVLIIKSPARSPIITIDINTCVPHESLDRAECARKCGIVHRETEGTFSLVCMHSRQFGFLKLNSPEQAKRKALVVRAIKYLERMLVQAQAEKQRRKADSTKACPDDSKENEDEDKGISIDPKTYCKLGHFHLLLEDYSKGITSFLRYTLS